jgi:hypothetical protein
MVGRQVCQQDRRRALARRSKIGGAHPRAEQAVLLALNGAGGALPRVVP